MADTSKQIQPSGHFKMNIPFQSPCYALHCQSRQNTLAHLCHRCQYASQESDSAQIYMQDDTWSHTLEAPKTRVYHTALRSLSLGPFGKTLSTGWLQPGTELRYCVHIVSSCDHPEAWGYQPLWRLHGYPVTMLLESWNDFLHQEEPQQGSRPKLGQSSGVCLTVSTSVQPQKGFSISTRDWFY